MSAPGSKEPHPDNISSNKKLETLLEIMDRLRDPGGCPWDGEQSFASLVPFVIEEAYEVVSAIDGGSKDDLREELGDLLLQVVFLAKLAKEEGSFDMNGVIEGISEKMIRRHPHVFGDSKADSSKEVLNRWAEIKAVEKEEKTGKGEVKDEGFLSDVPSHFPALVRANKVSKKAARTGFDWDGVDQILEKLDEELTELKEALEEKDRAGMEEELGDVLFSVVNIARFIEVDPENALRKTIGKFIDRFHYIEKELDKEGQSLTEASLEEMERLWQESKKRKGK